MSDSEDKSSKTEEASERKLKKAREDGNTYSSREPGHLMAYLALMALVMLVLPATLPQGLRHLSAVLEAAGSISVETPQDLSRVLGVVAMASGTVLVPALMVMLVAALVSALMAGPLVVSLKRVQPKFSKMNPVGGLKRLLSVGNLVEFLKSVVKLSLVAMLFLMVLRDTMDHLLPGALLLPETLLGFIGAASGRGLAWVCALMIPIVVFDIFWKRREWLNKMRMSKKDLKDESKDTDGDPHIRAKRQEIRRNRLRQNLTRSVPTATLVVTNPTHYAVALRYERGLDAAPICVAKGADLIALKIRGLALDHEVPVLESPALARSLHAVVEVDDMIPEEHWAAVAELVGYVLDLRRRIKRKLPEGTRVFEGA